MDLHAWITQQVDRVEQSVEEDVLPSDEAAPILRRCEADRRILARHRVDAGEPAFPASCEGCGRDDWGLPDTESINDCPELLDLAHAHGLTDDILAGLDRPQPPEPTPVQQRRIRERARLIVPITTSDVPEALRGPHWKP